VSVLDGAIREAALKWANEDLFDSLPPCPQGFDINIWEAFAGGFRAAVAYMSEEVCHVCGREPGENHTPCGGGVGFTVTIDRAQWFARNGGLG
jgi:hypothetical protein